jgi:hypothetical protein
MTLPRSDSFATDLEELRRLASRHGIPVEFVDRLTLRPREVARLTGFSRRTVERWLAFGELAQLPQFGRELG